MTHITVPNLLGVELPRQLIVYVLGIGATFVAAFVSWHTFESHFLRLKDRFPYESAPADLAARSTS